MTAKESNVNINPSTFATDGGLLDLSMEDIVSMFQDTEKRRHKDAREDENEQEVVVAAKTTPMGLVAVLDSATYNLQVSRSMLTKCMSHHIASWFDNMPDMVVLTELFYDAHGRAVSSGNPDLCGRLREVGYSFTSTVASSPTTFRSISWVQSKLGNLSLPLGLPPSVLFHIGLCWSISTSKDVAYKGTIDNYLREEISQFRNFVGYRLIRIRGFHESVEQRLGSK